jgi:4-amino-4-deoxy-L-arabinose transferase-like glycosyltransferase
MAKKREDRGKEKKSGRDTECNLDGDYTSPIQSFRDINFENIRSSIVNSRYIQILISLTIFGGFLRFYNLGYNSLWLDEATTYGVSQGSFAEIWQTSVTGEFHPPLFYWIEHLMLTFGHSEIVLRVVPALLGMLVIPAFYLIGKEFRDKNVGIISAALLTVSYFGIYYSQEARVYSAVLFVFSLAVLFYLMALRTDKIAHWVLFALLSALAVWLHYWVLIALGVIYLHAIISFTGRLKRDVREGKKLLIALCVMTVLILPLILVVIERYFALSSSAPTYGVLGPILIQETIVGFSGGYSPLAWPITIIYFLLMVAGLAFLFSEDRNKCLFSGMYLILPLVISILLSSKITMNPRYLIFLLPVFYALIAMSFPLMFRLIPNRKFLYAILILIIAINVPLLAGYYTSFTKEDWRGFAGAVQSTTKDGDWVVLVPGYVSQPFNYYYSNVTDKTIQSGANTGNELDAINAEKGNSSAYFIVTGDISAANPNGDAVAWLKNRTTLLGQDTGIYLFVAN